jgi:N-acetylneuraminic acid mutarotase
MNGKIYAFGGEDQNGTTLATVEAFDPVINSWIPRASMPTSRSGVAVGVINGIAYVVGGRSGSGSNVTFDGTVEAYDPATDSWTIKAAMPTPLDRGAAAVVGGILYVIGGQTGYCGCSITNVVEAYDPVSNTWTIKTSMPTPRTGPGATTVGSIIYALGGQNTVQNVRTVEAYDPSTDTWTTKPQMPTGRGHLGVGSINGVIYAVAGSADSNPYSPLVEAFDPVAETWSSIGSITTGRLGPGLAVINATLYAVGGANGSGVLSSVNTFVP